MAEPPAADNSRPSRRVAFISNDLQAPIEVSRGGWAGWRVVYPGRSISLQEEEVVVRLREATDVVGRVAPEKKECCTFRRRGELRSSRDFSFSKEARLLDQKEQQSSKRESKRRKAKHQSRERMLQDAAMRMRDEAVPFSMYEFCVIVIFPAFSSVAVLILLCVLVQPNEAVLAGVLTGVTLIPWAMLSLSCGLSGLKRPATYMWGSSAAVARNVLRLAWVLGLAALVTMTVRNILLGYWFFAFILWPLVMFCGGVFTFVLPIYLGMKPRQEEFVLERERSLVRKDMMQRTIVFEGLSTQGHSWFVGHYTPLILGRGLIIPY